VVLASGQVSEANGFLLSNVSRRELEARTHDPVSGLRQRECLAAGGVEGVETWRADGEWSPVGPLMKYPRLSVSSFSTGFQVNKFQKCSEIWLKESYKIVPCL